MRPPVAAMMEDIMTIGVIFASKSTPFAEAVENPAAILKISSETITKKLSSLKSLKKEPLPKETSWVTSLYRRRGHKALKEMSAANGLTTRLFYDQMLLSQRVIDRKS